MNDFVNSALHNSAPPVETEADALTSNSPAAHPTCAPDALIFVSRVELQTRWQGRPEFDAANRAWHELLNHLAAFHPAPAWN